MTRTLFFVGLVLFFFWCFWLTKSIFEMRAASCIDLSTQVEEGVNNALNSYDVEVE